MGDSLSNFQRVVIGLCVRGVIYLSKSHTSLIKRLEDRHRTDVTDELSVKATMNTDGEGKRLGIKGCERVLHRK